jgi:hypothetical protein
MAHLGAGPSGGTSAAGESRQPTVERGGIRDNVGNSRPATAPDPLLDQLVGSGQQRFWDGQALAVLRLMTNSNLVACTTGKSAGLAPLGMLPV